MEARQDEQTMEMPTRSTRMPRGQQNTPHAVTGQGGETTAVTSLIHRMLDVPRGCALSPGGRGRRGETAQVRGLGYSVSRRPAAGTPAPPAPDTPRSDVAAVTVVTAGRLSSRLSEEIWRGRSMAICRSGAYLRGSPWLIVREGVSRADRQTLGFRQAHRKSGYSRSTLGLGDFCATMFLCLTARYRL